MAGVHLGLYAPWLPCTVCAMTRCCARPFRAAVQISGDELHLFHVIPPGEQEERSPPPTTRVPAALRTAKLLFRTGC